MVQAAEKPANVVNLFEALKKSLAGDEGASAGKPAPGKGGKAAGKPAATKSSASARSSTKAARTKKSA